MTMTTAIQLKQKITGHAQNHLIRHRHAVEGRDQTALRMNGTTLINFCSSDYLNLATHPEVKKAFAAAANQYGLGSGSASLISGYFDAHRSLEEAFAEFLNRDRALLFNSGYHANLSVLSTLANRSSYIVADKLCHASLLDGIILSRAKHVRYAHHDYQQADYLLQQSAGRPSLLVSESIFSMEGDITDVKKLADIARRHQATLVVDDAHGMGALGKQGNGVCNHFNLSQVDVPCLITTFGKALGSFGAVVSGSDDLIESLIQFARPYIFTTALPPALCAATLAALTVLKKENWRREKLHYLSALFNQQATARGLLLTSFAELSPIKCILIGDNKKTIALQQKLLAQGFLVSCIRPPTVPRLSARIRISLNSLHTEQQIMQLLDELT